MDFEQRDLLLSVSYIYQACGMEMRALPLLQLLALQCGNDAAVLRSLAHAYVAADRGHEALEILDQLERIDAEDQAPGLLLLRSRALHQQGRLQEARSCFVLYVAARAAHQSSRPMPDPGVQRELTAQ